MSNDVDEDYDESATEIVHDMDIQENMQDNDIDDDASAYLQDSEQSEAEFNAYSKKYFLFKLKQRYGQHLYITQLHGRKNVVCFSNLVSVIIQETWKQQQNQEECSTAEALVKNAARLIAAQIREMQFDLSTYPATDDILQGVDFPVPPLVKTFMECLIKDKMKRAGVSQALVQCARPKTALMPLQYGLGVHLDRFASAELVKEVSRFGFCISHDEVNRFKQSAAQSDLNRLRQFNGLQPLQIQYVADNVDHNSRTIDGSGTLHAMGVISAAYVQKGNFSGETFRIPRLSKRLLAADVCKHQVVPILAFAETPGAHLANLKLDSIDKLITVASPSALHKLNNIWNVGWLLDNGNRPSWSGFMQLVTRGDHPSPSVIDFLPIVNLPPTDVNCILSTLIFIEEQATAMNVPEPCITFDQPLFVKALDIVLAKKLKLVVRLGGFHTALSFLGSIGNLMRGSGLEDILSVLYGKNVVENILQGRDYERAVRGHFLVHSALNALLIGVLVPTESNEESTTVCFEDSEQVGKYKLDASDVASLTSLHKQVLELKVWLTTDKDCTDGAMSQQSLQSSSLDKFQSNMAELRTNLSDQSRTSRLWILYMKYVELLKVFLMAERTSNWLLHLECLHGMLALFAATGHVHYAKSVRLYLQFMKNLPTSHPSLHAQFMSGMHTIRRSDRYWAGLSCDLVIEQTLMRSLKSRGGLTRGRGTHDTVRNLWLKSMAECARVSAAVATVIGLNQGCSESVEVGKSRIARDNADLRKLVDFLTVNSPFRFVDSSRIVSLLNGVSAGPDDGVTCDIADEVGLRIQESWNDVTYGSVTLHKTSRVKTLANMHNLFKVDDESSEIDANSLFHRLVVLAQRSENQAACFEFELAPFPTALFKDGFMRKPDKPALYREFTKNLTSQPVPLRKVFVIDGGCLLHRVRWTRGTVAGDIMHLYVRYIDCHFGKSSVVVFDGYDVGMTVKDHEHMRRAGKVSRIAADVKLELSTEIVFDQDAFLANPRNKQSFINCLSDCLNASNIEVVRSIGDADTDIAASALKLADGGQTAVVWADDTDILALLINHRTQDMADICFLSEAKGKVKGRNDSKCISIAAVQQKLGSYASRHILVAHAFGGCDTTSAIFGQGKGTVFKKVTQNKLLETSLLVMENVDASVADVTLAGLKIMSVVYGANGEESMGRMRFNSYNRLVTSNFGRFQAERLPPSKNATELHALRVHLQTVYWLTLGKVNLKAEEWGWKIQQEKLIPIQMTVKPGPDFLMSVIRCNCSSKGKCSSRQCSCVKNKLKCIAACGSCHGMDCANADDVNQIA
jgi:hypothetical protein